MAEINGSEGSAVYRMHDPNHLLFGKPGGDLEPIVVPDEFLKPKDSPRDPKNGEPGTVFRYDWCGSLFQRLLTSEKLIPVFMMDSVHKLLLMPSWNRNKNGHGSTSQMNRYDGGRVNSRKNSCRHFFQILKPVQRQRGPSVLSPA